MKNSRLYLFAMVLLISTLVAACGDPTATGVPTTVAPVTTKAATTTTSAPAGSVATVTPKPTIITPATPTTNDAKTTTVAPTTTSAVSTTTVARTGSSNITLEELNFSQLPASFARFPLTPTLLTYLKNQLKDDKVLGKDDSTLKAVAILGTDESNADVAGAKFDTALRAMGYSFAMAGYNNLLKLDTTLLGAYFKVGSPDLVVIGVPSADFLDNSSGDPLPAELANFAKGKKFVFVAISGTGIASIYTKENKIPEGMPTVGTK